MPVRTHKSRLVHIAPAALAGLAGLTTGLMLSVPATAANTTTQVKTSGTVVEMQRSDQPMVTRPELNLPESGATTMKQIIAEYGQPIKKHPAVGDPPITRWDYPGFSVYFEYNLFLHAVVPDDPEPLVHKDQLVQRGG